MAVCTDLCSDLTSEIAVKSPNVSQIYLGKQVIRVDEKDMFKKGSPINIV